MSECHVCDDCQRKVDEYGREVNAACDQCEALTKAVEDLRDKLRKPVEEWSGKLQSAERRCAEAVKIIKQMDCDCAGEGVGDLGGCYRCLALSKLDPAPQIAGEAKCHWIAPEIWEAKP